MTDFIGAKLALLCGEALLTYLRDDIPGLNWAGRWDLPGGGREGDETPQACALRELQEEFGLVFGEDRLEHGWHLPSITAAGRSSWFYLGRISPVEIGTIRFGDEGQYWRMMAIADFLSHPQGIPPLQDRLKMALGKTGWGQAPTPPPLHAPFGA